jgi:hypothetical protein
MNISEIAKHVKAKDKKPKLVKPNKGHESPHPLKGKLVGEADQPKDDVSARAKLDHSLRAQGHKVVPDKKKELKKGNVKHKGKQFEAAVRLHKKADLFSYLDSLLNSFKTRDPQDKELELLLKAMGKRLKIDKESGTYTIESIVPFDQCPKCGDEIFHEAEGKKDACYHKVKSRYKVWPSAYASGALVQCRKKGAKNWGNSSKKK